MDGCPGITVPDIAYVGQKEKNENNPTWSIDIRGAQEVHKGKYIIIQESKNEEKKD